MTYSGDGEVGCEQEVQGVGRGEHPSFSVTLGTLFFSSPRAGRTKLYFDS